MCKDKRYCKGCYADVTKTMFCYCGEFPLSMKSTVGEDEYNAIMDRHKRKREYNAETNQDANQDNLSR